MYLSMSLFLYLLMLLQFCTLQSVIKVMNVGEHLLCETLPFEMGSHLYRLNGLKSSTWYEVKISYPASKHVLVSVEPAGVVAIPGAKEREIVPPDEFLDFLPRPLPVHSVCFVSRSQVLHELVTGYFYIRKVDGVE
ncbi:hypothetical protein MKX03_013428 [Papaver bracteatum]|nr:hypothetical protein MKX03_013428 [Papaver bracteatum]